ncbi:MAG: hypothetical protein ACYC8W_07805 [Candidatus Tyrphobacter sp.]
MHIKIPAKPASAQSGKVRPQYVSPGTQSMTMQIEQSNQQGPDFTPSDFSPVGSLQVVNLTPGANPNCTADVGGTVCTVLITFPITPGVTSGDAVEFVANMYDGTNGTGNLLSTDVLDQVYIVPGGCQGLGYEASASCFAIGQNNVINIALYGVVDHWVASIPSLFTAGTSATETLTVTAYDPDGYIIVPESMPSCSFGSSCSPWSDGNAGTMTLEYEPTSGTDAALTFALPGSGCSPSMINAPAVSAGLDGEGRISGSTCQPSMSYTGSGTDTITFTSVHMVGATSTNGPIYVLNPFTTTSVTIPAHGAAPTPTPVPTPTPTPAPTPTPIAYGPLYTVPGAIYLGEDYSGNPAPLTNTATIYDPNYIGTYSYSQSRSESCVGIANISISGSTITASAIIIGATCSVTITDTVGGSTPLSITIN